MRCGPVQSKREANAIHRGKRVFSHAKYMKKKKEKRGNTPNGRTINVLMFEVLFLRFQCYKWQNYEARCFES